MLSACIVTGTEKVRSGFGNGDCVLCDLAHNIFAIADATERYPFASRLLLERLCKKIFKSGSPFERKYLQVSIENIYARQEYNHRSTLSCVAIETKGDGVTAHISNGGDSMILIVDSSDGSIVFRTDANMNFVGRSKVCSEMISMNLDNPNLRIILASDGFHDALQLLSKKCSAYHLSDKIPLQLFIEPIHDSVDWFQGLLDKKSGNFEYDDIGIIMLNPFRTPSRSDIRLLMGGTTAQEEGRFSRSVSSEKLNNWLPEPLWKDNHEMLGISGIKTF